MFLLGACSRSEIYDQSDAAVGGGGGAASGGGAGGGGGATCLPSSVCAPTIALQGADLSTIDTTSNPWAPDVTVDSEGRPVVAYVRVDASLVRNHLFVRRLENGHWNQLGCELTAGSPHGVMAVRLAADAEGGLAVAWVPTPGGSSTNAPMEAAVWDGSGWRALGPLQLAFGEYAPSRVGVVLAGGQPIVGWDESVTRPDDPFSGRVFVSRYDGSQWHQLGPALAGPMGEEVTFAALALGADGQPLVAFDVLSPSDSGDTIEVARWDGANWNMLPALPRPHPYSIGAVGLRTDTQGRVLVAWNDSGFQEHVEHPHVARLEQGSWSLLGEGFDGHDGQPVTGLAVAADDAPIAAQVSGSPYPQAVTIQRFDGQAWAPLLADALQMQVDVSAAVAAGPLGAVYGVWEGELSSGLGVQVWHPSGMSCP